MGSQFVNDDKEVKAEKDFRARVDIEIMDLKAKTEDKDCELDDLYQELEASRNKTVLMRGQMSQLKPCCWSTATSWTTPCDMIEAWVLQLWSLERTFQEADAQVPGQIT